jgi:hypothetical protein
LIGTLLHSNILYTQHTTHHTLLQPLKTISYFLSSWAQLRIIYIFSTNLLVIYCKSCILIGYRTHYLSADR